VVNDFADDVLALDPDANVIVLGDINDFHFSDTVRILEGTAIDVRERTVESSGEAPVLTTLFDVLPANEQYSYIFDGNSQVLDQILVSGNVLDRDPTYDVVHVNAEFAVQSSDHEPSVMRVAFQPRRGG
jgi:predicted extracellular nuclease